MSAGKGFIALAAVIFGAWNPIYAFGAALVFGFADAIQALLSILGVDVPPQLLNSVPYIVTIIVVAGVVGRVRGPPPRASRTTRADAGERRLARTPSGARSHAVPTVPGRPRRRGRRRSGPSSTRCR